MEETELREWMTKINANLGAVNQSLVLVGEALQGFSARLEEIEGQLDTITSALADESPSSNDTAKALVALTTAVKDQSKILTTIGLKLDIFFRGQEPKPC